MKLQTDLNQRERRKFAAQARALAEAASKLATALEAEDDVAAFVQLISVTIGGGFSELLEVFAAAAEVSKAVGDLDRNERS